MPKHRIAIIGLGMAVRPHAQSLIDLKDRVEVAYAFSPSEARRAAFAANFSFPLADSLDKILADKTVDCVEILTPPNTHLDLVRKCAAAGKHILLEKPLEVSTARAVALVDAAEQAGVTLGVMLQHRFRPAGMRLREMLRADRSPANIIRQATQRTSLSMAPNPAPGARASARAKIGRAHV